MFSILRSFLKQALNPRNILLGVLLLTSSFAIVDYGFAVSEGTMQERSNRGLDPATGASTAGSLVTQGANEGLKGLASLLGVLTSLVTLFIHPGWYNGDIFDINVYLKGVWILVSNVVYFIFAVILIWVAFMNIIGRGGDTYELKKALPKFIVGILIVPFSWFIVQFIVSLASVLSAAMLSLPFDTFKDNDAMNNFITNTRVSSECTINLGSNTAASGNGNSPTAGKGGFQCSENKRSILDMVTEGEGQEGLNQGIFGIMTIYTYGVLKMDNLDKLSIDHILTPGGVKNLANLGTKVIFSAIFVFVYLILLFALFLALFVRGAQLWIYMMISPLFGLFYFFGGSIGKLGKLSDFNLKNFIGLAMMPVYVSAALSFGLLFIATVNQGLEKDTTAKDGKGIVECTGGGQNQKCTLKLGGFKLTINGAFGDGKSSDGGGSQQINSPIGYLIMQMFAIVVLWASVMAALKTSTLTNSVIQPFESFGNSVGQMAMKLPTYAPIPGTNFSASTLQNVGSSVSEKLREFTTDRDRRWTQNNLPWATTNNQDSLKAAEKLIATAGNKSALNNSEVRANTAQMFSGVQDFRDINDKNQRATQEIAKRLGVSLDGLNLTKKEDYIKAWEKITHDREGERIYGGRLKPNSTFEDLTDFLRSRSVNQQNLDPAPAQAAPNTPIKPVSIPGVQNPVNVTINSNGNLDQSEIDKLKKTITDMPATARPKQSDMKEALENAGLKADIAETIAKGLLP